MLSQKQQNKLWPRDKVIDAVIKSGIRWRVIQQQPEQNALLLVHVFWILCGTRFSPFQKFKTGLMLHDDGESTRWLNCDTGLGPMNSIVVRTFISFT